MIKEKSKRDCYKDLIVKTAKDLGLTEEIVAEVVASQTKFAINIMQKGNMDSIKITYIGKLVVYPLRYWYKTKKESGSFNADDKAFLLKTLRDSKSIIKQTKELAKRAKEKREQEDDNI